MINHARTLLLNTNTVALPGTIGEEYIPPAYSPVAVPTYLSTARKILLGSDPERVFLNFRAYELLSFIHGTELAEFLYALDPRVTYWPNLASTFFRAATDISAQQLSGTQTSRIYIGGATLKPDNVRGRAFSEYNIKIINNTSSTATVEIVTDDGKTRVNKDMSWQSVTPNSNGSGVVFTGLSEPVSFPNSPMTFQIVTGNINLNIMAFENFIDAALEDNFFSQVALEGVTSTLPLTMASTAQEVLACWLVKMYAKPDSAISTCLPRLEFLGEPFYLELFGVGNSVEPYTTFKNIWFNHYSPAYRLAALTLAVIYRTNELGPQKNG